MSTHLHPFMYKHYGSTSFDFIFPGKPKVYGDINPTVLGFCIFTAAVTVIQVT